MTTPAGSGTLTDGFEVRNPAPTITEIIPNSGDRLWTGEVVFEGSGYLSGVTEPDFGGDGITVNGFEVNDPTRATAEITITGVAGLGPRDVSLTNPDGGTATVSFTVRNPAPTLAGIDPDEGEPGEVGLEILIAGDKFFADTEVEFNTPEITVTGITVHSPGSLTAVISIDEECEPGEYELTVVNPGPGGGVSDPQVFTVLDPAALIDPPQPQWPADRGLVVGLSPRLRLHPYPEAELFQFRVFEPENPVPVRTGSSPERRWEVDPPLELDQTYEWDARVRVDGAWSGYFSPRWSFTVVEAPPFDPGWVEVAPIPVQAGNRRDAVRRGSWLAFNEGDGLIYATKGNKLQDFYAYDALEDAWQELRPAPLDPTRGRPLERGCRGVADGENTIYMVHGNNTLAFWKYDIEGDTWTALTDVPEGPSRRRVRGGGDMLYLTIDEVGYVYFLKGDRTEFFRYNTETGNWEQLADAPMGIRPRWMRDSWLAYDGDNAIFAHKARYFQRGVTPEAHELWQYDIAGDSWIENVGNELSGMPLMGLHGGRLRNRRARDGGAGVYDNGVIYALKGGNSQQFWTYKVKDDAWVESDTMPTWSPTTGRRRRVNAGAYLERYSLFVFFALKGNRTAEFWRYVVPVGDIQTQSRQECRSHRKVGHTTPPVGISVTPSLVTGNSATLRYSLASPGPVSVKVYDATGRSVLNLGTRTNTDLHGQVSLDMRNLSAGIYLVKLEADGFTGTRKLVVQR